MGTMEDRVARIRDLIERRDTIDEELAALLGVPPEPRQRKVRRCRKCGELGHLAKSCPSAQAGPNAPQVTGLVAQS